MKIVETFSYRYADAILEKAFPAEQQEIIDVIEGVEWSKKSPPVIRERGGRVVARLTLDQKGTNKSIDSRFESLGWTPQPKIVSHSDSNLKADFKKGPIQVEVQFGNMARWYTDVFKFLLSYAADDIEVGVLIVAMKNTAIKIDENVVDFERIARELPHAKMAVTIPVWVVGIGS